MIQFYDEEPEEKQDIARAVISTLAALSSVSSLERETILQDCSGAVGWDAETIKTVGNGIEARLRGRGFNVYPIADVDYENCNTVGSLIDLMWNNIWIWECPE
jgi:hypothetical protein